MTDWRTIAIDINACDICPHLMYLQPKRYRCRKTGRPFTNNMIVQKFCPFPKAEWAKIMEELEKQAEKRFEEARKSEII
jgi:hypothetical protein